MYQHALRRGKIAGRMTLASPLTDTGRGISTKHRFLTFRTSLFSLLPWFFDYHEELATDCGSSAVAVLAAVIAVGETG